MSAPGLPSRLRRFGESRRYRHALTPWPHRRGPPSAMTPRQLRVRALFPPRSGARFLGSPWSGPVPSVSLWLRWRMCPHLCTLMWRGFSMRWPDPEGSPSVDLSGPLWWTSGRRSGWRCRGWPGDGRGCLGVRRWRGHQGMPRATEAGPPGDAAGDGERASRGFRGPRRQGHQGTPRSARRRGGTPCGGGCERLRSRTGFAGAEQALQACRRLQHLSQATRRRRR